ncbi:MAG: Crp/Fnr family transcriptional regulator [Trueperaceae bacterium]|nr:Crp/Fnr family transcriptional regulator [Trueperaceae bacterium]
MGVTKGEGGRAPHLEEGTAGHCSAAVRLEVLGRTTLFRTLDPDALRRVNDGCRAVPAEPGETILREGEPAERLFVVATGAVKLVRHGADGKAVLLDVIVPGEWFGSLGALGDDAYRHDAVVLRPGCLLLLSAEAFRDLLREVPGVAEAALDVTAQRLREAQGAVRSLATLPVEGRLAATLLQLASKVGREGPDGVRLEVAPTQVDLAAMTGTSFESVSRVFARWRARGLIATTPEGPLLRDLAGLAALAGEGDLGQRGDPG